MTTVGNYKIKSSLTKNKPAMEKSITSLTSGDNKTNGKKTAAFTKFANELNIELRERNLEIIKSFDPRSRIGGGASIYPPSFRQHSPVVAGDLMQQWSVECDYNTKVGKIWIMATCPFMALKTIASKEAFTDSLLNVTRVEPIVRVDASVCYGAGNMIKIEFDRKRIDDEYLVEIFADLLSCLDMKMQEIDFTSGAFDSFEILDKRITMVYTK